MPDGDNEAMRVLLVEDHRLLADRIAEGLRGAGVAVDLAWDGERALEVASETEYDVVVLDRDIPKIHGDRVCRELSQASPRPRIIMLTASSNVSDRVDGFELGADDYLGKPFAFAELVARVRALGRREPSAAPVIRRGDLTIDRARRTVTRAGYPVVLSKKEFGLLETLAAAGGAVISAETLLERVWDSNTDAFSNVVAVTLARLRKKLGDPDPIQTLVGAGYRL